MFGIGFTEIVIVALIALVVVGPDKLPEIANYMGKLFASFRRANLEIKQTISNVKPPDVMEIIEKRIKDETNLPNLEEVLNDSDKKPDPNNNDNNKEPGSDDGNDSKLDKGDNK